MSNKYDKGKITRPDGRSSIEEFTTDPSFEQDVPPAPVPDSDLEAIIAQDARNTFGDGPKDPVGRSTGPNVETGPLSDYNNLYNDNEDLCLTFYHHHQGTTDMIIDFHENTL